MKLEITLYSCGEQIDDYSARLQEKADHWVDLRGQADEACLAQILRDEIDILVDLAGHTAGNRLALLAAKGSTDPGHLPGLLRHHRPDPGGLLDHRSTLHPPDRDAEDPCTETRWRLDRCYVSYRPPAPGTGRSTSAL